MTSDKTLMIVMGTRPEAIKLAPVALAAQRDGRMRVVVVRTSQHRQMLDQMVEAFGLPIAVDLDIMRHDQSLTQVTTAALEGLDRTIAALRPTAVVVQGDTTTTFCGALAAFHHRVPVAHVEAGLRTHDRFQPFPEEVNRRLTAQVTDFHFAPTEGAEANLRREGVPDARIWVTGNTAIDALRITLERAGERAAATGPERRILVTAHRRENHGEPMAEICRALVRLCERFEDVRVRFPVHLSPRVRATVFERLQGHPRIALEEPLGYEAFVLAMSQAHLILSDSGGVQEEAPALGKPVLVLRETTERPEACEAGCAMLVGTNADRIFDEASRLLSDEAWYGQMARAKNPFGDGHAAERIVSVLADALA
ncbi:non-hydrolyzing UDP-N-acetylglucosamine 2-epimerase [Paraliomyxa miuraensis]|uniref:non-hydrolyzing UDP-N-acetylglucosamine 2-epimerase n=1 Tax=Paraliomyxa miuraensis TaxID=376150 RepID=UPI0022555025|nr:UDP-N-acetylglucosamine 2-epimerase (non-hydrolyzing) [Paraliomyxa miuraensis]MCX4243115.1 UDP-N-acetylglucosamine 2-epimerase (non-hydrolyzing) [Paraliomyxa miuraensis]